MTAQVVVLGAGYAGAGAVQTLEDELDDARLTWISDTDYHPILHESHRIIRDPGVRDHLAVPVQEIKSSSTRFIGGTVTNVDTDERVVSLDDGTEVEYDYVLVALGSATAYYGIPGLDENSLTLKSLDDAMEIHESVKDAARGASREDPAQVAIGGAGLSGIQSAGEVAEFRDRHNAPIEITLIEALPEIMPGQDPELQGAVKKRLQEANVEIMTDDPITEADADAIRFDEGDPLDYDTFVWAGGITGRESMENANVEKEHNRVVCDATFQTDNDRVFAIGDAAVIEQDDEPAPPTAQAAWQAADLVGENVARAMNDRPLKTWTHKDKGTLVSIGDEAVAHDVQGLPVSTFGSVPAELLKKGVAARWIADVSSVGRAKRAWKYL